jgi:hypothetical protein
MPIEDRVREAVDTFMARVRHDLDAHVRGLTSDLLRLFQDSQAGWRSDLDQAVNDARAEAERTSRARLESLRSELALEMDTQLSAARAELQSVKATVRERRSETLDRLLAAVRRLDEAKTLTGILQALAQGAAAETSRVAIFLVEGDMLQVWGQFGFASATGPVPMAVADAGALTAAVALRQTSFVSPRSDARDTTSPAFMRVPAGHSGLVVPIIVGGETVAVLYADDVNKLPQQEDAPRWSEEVELLVRHASLRLENVTSARTVDVLTRPA